MSSNKRIKVAVIGAGAAGFFTAVNAAGMSDKLDVTIFEKSKNLLSKVRISGGGRCNVTNHCFDPVELSKAYPRGGKMMRWNFEKFQPRDTVEWFESRGVRLKAEDDGRMFPVTDSSETIIDCLLREAKKVKVTIRTQVPVTRIEPLESGGFRLHIPKQKPELADVAVVASGGSNRVQAYEWLKELGHSVNPPVPSLFTFNFRIKNLTDLAGISVHNAQIEIEGTRFSENGPVLITHWGLSGPAVLKLSARAARLLNEMQYRYTVRVNWLHPLNQEQVRNKLMKIRVQNIKKKVDKQEQFPLPGRLWVKLLTLAGIKPDRRWAEISNKEIYNLTLQLVGGSYDCQGKTTYKEEFVTCGGIPLSDINPSTLESKKIPELYFVGEVLDIDGITGGYNFQAAWTNGWLAAKAIALNAINDVS
ncbi:MAG: NAD(P)/FAD-dependent oxidoreductase [Balneolaceae bacterium]|nr:MAG: NAD(P)/FAD-dependent oxidoreductase [Balneolaceae bacterium]